MTTIESIKKHKIVAIARRIYGEDLKKLTLSLQKGGIYLVEVTFDQNDPEHLKKTGEALDVLNSIEGIAAGAGTVLNEKQLQVAFEHGAKYIVSPNVNELIIKETKKLGLISIPGACTPTEIMAAYDYGADVVKIFPALPMGFEYLKAICQPLNHIPFIANAGVEPQNIQEFLSIGFTGFGISNFLCDRALIKDGRFEEITARAKLLKEKIENYE